MPRVTLLGPAIRSVALGLVSIVVLAGLGNSGAAERPGNTPVASSGERGDRKGRSALDVPPTVAVAAVVRADAPQYLDAVGTVVSRSTAVVRARVAGQLDRVLFKEGQLVKAGQALAVLDQRPFQVALDQQRAQWQRDEAQLGNARQDLARYQGLVNDHVIPQQQVDTQAALVRQYQAVVAIDQAQIASAELNLNYATIRAPIAGRVGLRQVDVGNLVSSTDTNGIVLITQMDPIDVVFALPAERVLSVVRALSAGKHFAVQALDRDGKTNLANGEVLAADSQIDTSTGTIKFKAQFRNPDGRLYPNQFVNVRVLLSVEEAATLVPDAAIQRMPTATGQTVFAYVLRADNTVTVRPVVLSKSTTTNTNSVVVQQGLSPGEQVVVDGVDGLREGRKVVVGSLHAQGAQ